MIKQIIYSHYENKLKEEKEKKLPGREVTFSPSSLSECRRKLYYKFLGYEQSNPLDAAAMVKMDMGSTVHLNIQNILKERGIYLEGEELKEIEYFDIKFRYRIDGLVLIHELKYIFELKTVYASGYNSIEREPKPEHVAQTVAYMLFEKIPRADLLYIGRDNGFMVEYILKIQDNDLFIINDNGQSEWEKYSDYILNFQKRCNELHILRKQIDTGNEPNRDYQIALKNNKGVISEDFQKDNQKIKTDWHCGYCSWKGYCWKDVFDNIGNHKFYIDSNFID